MSRAVGTALAAGLLLAASLAIFWPGYAMYDTVAQYGQVLEGGFEDWHPPAMARLWAALRDLGAGDGTAPMLVVQLALYWLGLGLIAAALGGRRAAAVLAIGAWPVFLGWQVVVLKDAQMTGALLAATGTAAWWRLRGRRMPWPAVAGAVLLVAYAVLVRANAVFAAVPLAVLLSPIRAPLARGATIVLATLAVLALQSPVNHRLLGAGSTGVERTQALYDLAGIAVRVPAGAPHTGLLPVERAQLVARACVRPFFWDPLGEPRRCDATVDRLRDRPVGDLYATLADAALHHPFAYAAQRLAHLNSTDRWLVPFRWPGAAPPRASERNDEGLGSPGRLAAGWQAATGWLVETPLGWPAVWIAAALIVAAASLAWPPSPPRDLALALAGSALGLEASFAVLSIASDLRYHLWPMIATALATVLLSAGARPARRLRVAAAALLAAVILAGVAARLALPSPPQTYAGMMG